jgi:predicted O-methyltransferase YrrM
MDKVSTAITTFQEQGTLALAQKVSTYLLNKSKHWKQFKYRKSLEDIRARMESEEELEDILDTVMEVNPGHQPYRVAASQYRDEIERLAKIVNGEEVETVLEIGTASGGTLYIWARYLNTVEKIISLDLPGGDFGGGYKEEMKNIYRKFAPSKEMHFVRKDSHKPSTFEEISDISDEIDFLFIDGDHSYQGVKQDYEMYSKLVSDGGLIAFHDIVETPDNSTVVQKRREKKGEFEGLEDRHLIWGDGLPNCKVSEFWEELVEHHNTEEIVSHPKQSHRGIGIIRM